MRRAKVLVTATIVACVGWAVARGAVYRVDPDGGGDFATIQAAVEAVAGGDVIELGDGEFRGDGNRDVDYLGKSIVIRSQSGNAGACLIDCGGSDGDPHRGFLFRSGEDAGASLEGVTITHGWAEAGGAIYMAPLGGDAPAPRIRDCVFAVNTAWRGGAIHLKYACAPEIRDCVFLGNVALGSQCHGGALFANRSPAEIVGCTFSANGAEGFAACGGGAYSEGAPSPVFEDCVFAGNTSLDEFQAYTSGGGLYVREASAAEVRECYFSENEASYEGGGVCCVDGQLFLEKCTFSANSATRGGGLVCCGSAVVDVLACTFIGNGASEEGGAVACGCSAEVTLEQCILANSSSGGAVDCAAQSSCTITLSCCDVWGNEGGNWSGCISDQWDHDGNLYADPCFCADGLHIAYASPCFPDSNDCGVYIGAWEHGCWSCGDDVPVRRVTWGRLRAVFRAR